MKEFTKNDRIDYEDVKVGEIIKFDNHYLIVKADDSCLNCFFGENEKYDCGILIECIGRNGEEINFEEISEIERLIMYGD